MFSINRFPICNQNLEEFCVELRSSEPHLLKPIFALTQTADQLLSAEVQLSHNRRVAHSAAPFLHDERRNPRRSRSLPLMREQRVFDRRSCRQILPVIFPQKFIPGCTARTYVPERSCTVYLIIVGSTIRFLLPSLDPTRRPVERL